MKKIAFLLFFIGFFGVGLFAQTTVTGTVTDENGGPIAGATVRVKDKGAAATMTDFSGAYSLNVPAGGTILEASYIGMETVEATITGTEMNFVLKSSDQQITKVVVTGMGIKRDEKKVGYAITSVGSEEVTKTKTSSAFDALKGKIPGVNITSASGSAGASTRVIFRGFSTISGSNQPLYIVDGVPISNASSGSTSLNGGTDFGNQANDIPPDDIESISFLKGSAATAIYGNRAANGVVIITTKNGGNAKKGLSVTVSSTYKFSSPLRLPQLQNIYGQGIFGNWDQRENTSYGPKFDDKLRYWGHVVDGERLIKPYSALPNNVSDFFEVGQFMQNSMSIMGGGDDTHFRLSFSNTNDDGIMPYDRDSYKRNSVSFNGGTKLDNRISAEASITYLNKQNKFVPTGQGGQSVYNNVLQQPRDIPILELANYDNKFFNKDYYYSPYTTNPYWPLLENGNKNNEDRVYGMTQITYELTPKLKAMYRVGADVSNTQLKEWRAKKINDAQGFNAAVDPEYGSVEETTRWRSQLNSDFIVMYDNNFGPVSLSVLAGHNIFQSRYRGQYSGASNIDIEGFYDLTNTKETPSVGEYSSLQRLVGVYGNVELNYKNWLNLSATARNDWSSTLPLENNSFFYPGVSVGFVFTDAIPALKDLKKVFPYGKLRVSYGQTGNDAGLYSVYPFYTQASRFPLPNQVNGFTLYNSAGNTFLQPEMTREFEIGTDLRFFNGKYSIDFTYYNRSTDELIIDLEKTPSTGYTSQTSNLGEINNSGIELMVTMNPIQRKKFNLNLTWNFAINKSTVVKLGELDSYDYMGLLGGTEVWWRFYPENDSLGTPGRPIGVFEVSAPDVVEIDGEEHIIVNAQGIPQIAESGYKEAGTSEHAFITGLGVDMTFFELVNLSATVDWHHGGVMHSRTAGMVYFTGISPNTLYNDRQPFVVPNSVRKVGEDENGDAIYVENTLPVIYDVLGGSANSYWDMGGELVGRHEIIDKTYIKLRDAAISFNIPKSLLSKTPFGYASLGIVGNNLLIWTPKSNNIIDPEMTTYGNDLLAEFGEFGATPTIRVIGFNLTLKF